MALLMSWTETDTGDEHPSSYWDIDYFKTQFVHAPGTEQAATEVVFKGWDEQDDHDDGRNPIHQLTLSIPAGVIDLSQTVGEGIAALYSYALSQPFFATATTV